MKKVSGPQVVTSVEALESPLPAEIQEALGELVGTRTALTNQLRAELERFWPGPLGLFTELHSRISLAFLERYPSPADARGLGEARLQGFLAREHYTGRQTPAQLLAKLRRAPATRVGELELATRFPLRCQRDSRGVSVGRPSRLSVVRSRDGGKPKPAVERDAASPVDAVAWVEDAVRPERTEPRAQPSTTVRGLGCRITPIRVTLACRPLRTESSEVAFGWSNDSVALVAEGRGRSQLLAGGVGDR
jgi:hypothetical protein